MAKTVKSASGTLATPSDKSIVVAEASPAAPAVPPGFRRDLQKKFMAARKELNDVLLERGQEVDLALCALAIQEHLMLVGPRGTAKSLVGEGISQLLDCKPFIYHFCQDSTSDGLFGPIRISRLAHDEYERVLDNGLANAVVAIGEELNSAGPAIRDTMFLVLNERVYINGTKKIECPLRFFLAISNIWVDMNENAATGLAFFDRFLLRSEVRPVTSRVNREALLLGGERSIKLSAKISVAELDKVTEDVLSLPVTQEAADCCMEIIEKLRNAKITPSDRRIAKCMKVAKAAAYLAGADKVEPFHLEILQHVLWENPGEERAQCAQIVVGTANPTGMEIGKLRAEIDEIYDKTDMSSIPNLSENSSKLQKIGAKLAAMSGKDPRIDETIDYLNEKLTTIRNESLKGIVPTRRTK